MIDLHIHSNYSDGLFPVEQLAAIIKKSGLEYCSLTDHDTVDGVEKIINALEGSEIKAIPGVELSAIYNEREIHILAYDFNINEVKKILKKKDEIVDQQKAKELDRARKLFIAHGFEVSHCLEIDNKNPAGLTIALDVFNNSKNQEKLLKIHGRSLSKNEFYDFYQAPGAPCFVARGGVGAEWIIKQFRKIANDLILAHPLNAISFFPPLKLNDINNLINLGLDGVEIYHPDLNDAQIRMLEKLVLKGKLKFTGGSDFHGKDDVRKIGFYSDGKIISCFRLSRFQSV